MTMTTIRSTLLRLSSAKEGSRELDVEIGQLVGWQRGIDTTVDTKANNVVWLSPDKREPGRVPRYTTNLEQALKLANFYAPSDLGGFSWEPGAASAKLGSDKAVKAATPALAICAATLLRHLRKSVSDER